MGLFNKEKEKKELYSDYPTKDEYLNRVKQIQSEELKSDRYMLVYVFLTHNYWNRENEDLEKELFKIIGTHDLEESIFNESSEYKKSLRMKKNEMLKQFISSLTEEQINSNIFLKSTYLFMNMSNEVCSAIMTELYDKINSENVPNLLTLEFQIPEKTQELIPNYIPGQKGIKYYRPEDYRTDYIDVLDSTHKYVYEDYNLLVEKLGKLAEDVYYLKLNEMIFNIPSLECYHFQAYHPGYNNHFIASFFVRKKQNNQTPKENNFTPTEEFIQNTVANFKQLLDMGLVNIPVLEEKNTDPVLKKKMNETK